tara:strand:- start:4949 stop:5692 length:744 start_codon:yes stop_codon:yes gene_type:complete
MPIIQIDINSDVGEGIGNEYQLLPLLSSCNIACGEHAGNEVTMREVIKLAVQHKVKIGAHPSYPDKENFGRISISITPEKLIESIQKQLLDFVTICDQEKAILHHIKPHGALYNDIAKNTELASLFLKTIEPYKETVKLYVPYNSVIEKIALKNNFKILYEAFLDRNYNDDLSLVSRKLPNSLLENKEEVLKHLIQIIQNKQVKTINQNFIPLKADTYCIHGDTATAFEILTYLHNELPTHNIAIKK